MRAGGLPPSLSLPFPPAFSMSLPLSPNLCLSFAPSMCLSHSLSLPPSLSPTQSYTVIPSLSLWPCENHRFKLSRQKLDVSFSADPLSQKLLHAPPWTWKTPSIRTDQPRPRPFSETRQTVDVVRSWACVCACAY